MAIVNAVILAAGKGTRMKSELPKVLNMICGRPMIAYSLNLATSVGAKQPIVVLGHGAEEVKSKLPKEANVIIQSKQRGTGDAVIAAKRAIGSTGDVLVLYADTPLLRRTTVQRLIHTHLKSRATCTLLTAHLADPSGYGRVLRNENGLITGVVEDAETNAAQRVIREVNVGPFVCKAQALHAALEAIKASPTRKEVYLTPAVEQIASQEGQKVQALRVEEVAEALGINTRADLARAIGIIRKRIIDTHMQRGVTIEDAQTTFIDHGVSVGVDTVIHPYSIVETGSSIGKRCSIGPFARLRSGVSIADDVRVGNFVELVRTKVASGVRVSHVAYLGDATVDEDANIGAGTITANYDGEEKHPTHIGKGALIGSDTVLIAPVKIGAKAITGAGSIVTRSHNVPDRGVVMGVPAQPVDLKKRAADNEKLKKKKAGTLPSAKRRKKPVSRRKVGKGKVKGKVKGTRRRVRKQASARRGAVRAKKRQSRLRARPRRTTAQKRKVQAKRKARR